MVTHETFRQSKGKRYRSEKTVGSDSIKIHLNLVKGLGTNYLKDKNEKLFRTSWTFGSEGRVNITFYFTL